MHGKNGDANRCAVEQEVWFSSEVVGEELVLVYLYIISTKNLLQHITIFVINFFNCFEFQ